MIYSFCAQTDAGRTRKNNEDSVVFDEATHIAVLADGMGGYNAGEVASGMATAFIRSELVRWLQEAGEQAQLKQVRRAIEICVHNANLSIFHSSAANPHYAGMGTTLVMGVFREHKLLLGHVGDSRCYRLRDKTLEQITKDHSLLQEQIDAGLLTPAQALLSPNRNLVTRALGVENSVLMDLHEYDVEPDDLYLMCSDGLSDMVGDAVISNLLQGAGSLERIATELVTQANHNGGRDNITVLLVKATGPTHPRGLISKLLGK